MKDTIITNKSKIFVINKLLLSSVFFCISIVHANNIDGNKSPTDRVDNTLILNQGHGEQVIAKSQDELNGNKSFQSKLTTPGITITEQIRQQANGHNIQENKIVVNISDNKSVHFIQKFDGEGRKISRSIIKQPMPATESFPSNQASQSQESLVASEAGRNGLAIEQKIGLKSNGKVTSTTIRTDNFSFISGTKNWMITASGGYAHYSNAMGSDGSTGLARLALNRTLWRLNGFDFGLEAGIQNGVNLRPIVQQQTLEALGGPAILGTIKPVFELLPTISKQLPYDDCYSAFAKFGIAYRTMTFDRDTIPNISRIAPDLQLGLASEMSENLKLMLYYQVLFGDLPNIRSSLAPLPANNHGKAENIPTEQGILLGAAYSF